jgi:hypothetical protein
MKRFSLIVLAIAVAPLALAAVLNLSWQNATTNVDGTAIPASGPGSVTTRIEYGTCNAARDAVTTVLGTIDAPNGATTAATPNLAPGVYCARAQHINTFGVASVFSAVASKEILPPQPNPPTNFSFGS